MMNNSHNTLDVCKLRKMPKGFLNLIYLSVGNQIVLCSVFKMNLENLAGVNSKTLLDMSDVG